MEKPTKICTYRHKFEKAKLTLDAPTAEKGEELAVTLLSGRRGDWSLESVRNHFNNFLAELSHALRGTTGDL